MEKILCKLVKDESEKNLLMYQQWRRKQQTLLWSYLMVNNYISISNK